MCQSLSRVVVVLDVTRRSHLQPRSFWEITPTSDTFHYYSHTHDTSMVLLTLMTPYITWSGLRFCTVRTSGLLWVLDHNRFLQVLIKTHSFNNNPPTTVSFIPAISSTSGRLHREFIRLLFLQTHRETDRFFATSGVQLVQRDRGLFHFRLAAFFAILKVKVGSTLAKATASRINLNIDGTSITSHLQTSRLLNLPLALAFLIHNKHQSVFYDD